MIKVEPITAEDWKRFSEMAHIAVFDKDKPKELERIDYAILVVDEKEDCPIGYVTCKELDGDTVYWQYGGFFKDFQKSIKVVHSIKKVRDWCFERYKTIATRVENTNFPMLKIYMSLQFRIVGLRVYNSGVYLEHLLDRKDGNITNIRRSR